MSGVARCRPTGIGEDVDVIRVGDWGSECECEFGFEFERDWDWYRDCECDESDWDWDVDRAAV